MLKKKMEKQTNTKKKAIITTIVILGIAILLISGVYATEYKLFCLEKGETIDFSLCGNNNATCDSDSCSVCAYKGSLGDYWCPATANPNPCNALGLTCSGSTGGNTTLDQTPPNVTINFPDEGYVSQERRLEIDVSANENSRFSYSVNGGNFRTMCYQYSMNCISEVNLDEGENFLEIKATDQADNEGLANITIIVDSRGPRILRTEPRRGFSNGNFQVEFMEDTPKNLTLYYGNSTDLRNYEVDIENECDFDGRGYNCDVSVNVSSYDGQEIQYWFVLKDVANNTDESNPYDLDVDNSEPKILNGNDFYEVDGKYVYFNINITEANLDEVVLKYEYERYGRVYERSRKLCSRLDNGICEKKFRYRDYYNNFKLVVVDEAGNLIEIPL
jgi:hypothetical protein